MKKQNKRMWVMIDLCVLKNALSHHEKYSENIKKADIIRNSCYLDYKKKQDNEKIEKYSNPDLMHEINARKEFNENYLINSNLSQGQYNIGIKIPDGIYAFDETGVLFPANEFPEGSLKFNYNNWYIQKPFTQTPIIIKNKSYVINKPYVLVKDNMQRIKNLNGNIDVFYGSELGVGLFGISKLKDMIIFSLDSECVIADNGFNGAYEKFLVDYFNKNNKKEQNPMVKFKSLIEAVNSLCVFNQNLIK